MQLDIQILSGAWRDRVIFRCIAGSQAYGTATAESDQDERGVFVIPAADYLGLTEPPIQLQDERSNIVYFSLRRFLELASVANPTVLELLFMPEDCVQYYSPEMNELIAQRDLFITRQCIDTHLGYARTQIKKARGQNKWINNPQPEQAPAKEDFCYVISREHMVTGDLPPARPLQLAQSGLDLSECHCASLEHTQGVYRLYHYGSKAKGVFRGDVLVCESIPMEDEAARFSGLLLFNEQAWQRAVLDHRNYWDWRNNRNEARWRQQEVGELDYDAKNLMHTMRLLLSGKSIVEQGVPTVRFSGTDLELLREIRAGRYGYAELLKMARELIAQCEQAAAHCSLPLESDKPRIDRLLRDLTAQWQTRQG